MAIRRKKRITSACSSFAAVKAAGSVVTWGDEATNKFHELCSGALQGAPKIILLSASLYRLYTVFWAPCKAPKRAREIS